MRTQFDRVTCDRCGRVVNITVDTRIPKGWIDMPIHAGERNQKDVCDQCAGLFRVMVTRAEALRKEFWNYV